MGKDKNPYAVPESLSTDDVERPPRSWLAVIAVNVCLLCMFVFAAIGNVLFSVIMLLVATSIFAEKFYQWRDYQKRQARTRTLNED